MKKELIKHMEEELDGIPEEFAEAKEEDTEEEKKIYINQIKNDLLEPSGDDENQIWEQGYYSGYKVALIHVKHFLKADPFDGKSIDNK